MKQFLLALTIVAIATSGLSAQRLGNGRLLRRLIGMEQEPEEPETEEKPASQKLKTDATRDAVRSASKTKRKKSSVLLSETSDYPAVSTLDESGGHSPAVDKILRHDGFGLTVKLEKKNVVVTRMDKSGTAAAAGLKQGDVIQSIASLPIQIPADLDQLDTVLEPGDEVEFTILRNKKTQSMSVAFERQVERSNTPDLAGAPTENGTEDRDTTYPIGNPTLAIRPENIPGPVERSIPSNGEDVERLTRIIELQQSAIEELQGRVRNLESQLTDSAELRTSRKTRKPSKR